MMIKIQPFDTLFFRDGKPFTMSEDTWADGIFPPLPSTVYGAMRTVYISHNGGLVRFRAGEMKDKIGTIATDDKGSFTLKAVYILQNDDTLYFPIPLDLVYDKESKDNNKAQKVRYLNNNKELIITNLPPISTTTFPPTTIKRAEVKENAFISIDTLNEYLNGTNDEFSFYELREKFIEIEPKIGIKRSLKTLTTEEGYLYRVGMNRLKENCFLVADFCGLDDFPTTGMIRLGGESKCGWFEKVSNIALPQLSDKTKKTIEDTHLFKLYFITPSIFIQGWLPSGVDDNLQWQIDGLTLKLLTATVGKQVHIGGWDVAANRPKPMRKAIPPGSVYYFEIIEGKVDQLIAQFHYKNISDYLKEEGYGLTLVGVI